jgi:hypothetical protein
MGGTGNLDNPRLFQTACASMCTAEVSCGQTVMIRKDV